MPNDKVRARILDQATTLFYNEGINNVGVDRISALAPVSKRTLYQRFPTKDKLVTEYLETMGETTYEGLVGTLDDSAAPADRILEVFRVLRADSAVPGYRGCPFLNAAAEIPDPEHPGRVITLHYKDRMLGFFQAQAARTTAADPDELGEQLMMLLDGAMSYALVRNVPVPASLLTAARTMLDAHLPSA